MSLGFLLKILVLGEDEFGIWPKNLSQQDCQKNRELIYYYVK